MKNTIMRAIKNPMLWLFAIVGLSVGLMSFDRQELAAQGLYKTWSGGAISNAENDTLSFPYVMESPYQYAFQFRFATSAGTRAGKIYLEQVLANSATNWMKVDSTSLSAGVTDYLLRSANSYGLKYRVIVDGSGTQTTTYTGYGLLKKTN